MLNYHGYDRDGLQQETYSGLADFADREGFILVSPDGAGSPRQWEVVGVYGDSGMDDVSFTSDLVASLEANYCIDLDRIYALAGQEVTPNTIAARWSSSSSPPRWRATSP